MTTNIDAEIAQIQWLKDKGMASSVESQTISLLIGMGAIADELKGIREELKTIAQKDSIKVLGSIHQY